MDKEIDYEFWEDGKCEHEFIEIVTMLSERNRARQVREWIESEEVSRRIRDFLGIDGFELMPGY